jgi:hypothetical protein
MAQRNPFPPADVPLISDMITVYDRAHFPLYLYLLDSAALGYDWEDLPPEVLGIDPRRKPERARVLFETNLARAKWMTEVGYRRLLEH